MGKKTSIVKIKQKKVLKAILENDGKPMGEAMREAGYSDNYADNPQLLTKTETWQELVEEYFPDRELFETHKAALKANVVVKHAPSQSAKETDTPDHEVRMKALDLAYKVKGTYAPEKFEDVTGKKTLEELEEEEKALKTQLRLKNNDEPTTGNKKKN